MTVQDNDIHSFDNHVTCKEGGASNLYMSRVKGAEKQSNTLNARCTGDMLNICPYCDTS